MEGVWQAVELPQALFQSRNIPSHSFRGVTASSKQASLHYIGQNLPPSVLASAQVNCVLQITRATRDRQNAVLQQEVPPGYKCAHSSAEKPQCDGVPAAMGQVGVSRMRDVHRGFKAILGKELQQLAARHHRKRCVYTAALATLFAFVLAQHCFNLRSRMLADNDLYAGCSARPLKLVVLAQSC
jgi:hypothetical protein